MLQSLLVRLSLVFVNLIEIIYPSTCIGCKEQNSPLCDNCLSNISRSTHSPEEFISSLFSYKDETVKRAIWYFKLEGKRNLAKPLSTALYDLMLETLADEVILNNFKDPLLISVPGSKSHNKRRGYDQGKLLCKNLEQLDGGNFFLYQRNVLTRSPESTPQTDITNKYKRIQNIKNAFSVPTKHTRLIKNRNIILVDDVTTTGATLKEIQKILKKAGAKRTLAFTIAH